MRLQLSLLAAGLWCLAAAATAAPANVTLPGPPFPAYQNAAEVQTACEQGLVGAKARVRRLERRRADAGWIAAMDDLAAYLEDVSGPIFVLTTVHPDKVVRKACYDQRVFRLSTPSDVIFGVGEEGASGTNGEGPKFQVATPAASSWGAKGYGEVWLNDSNAWVWPHVHQAAAQMKAIATERRGTPSELERRALNQLARELVLASSSDWPFIMTMGTMVPYAERRVREHINRFNRLLGQLRESRIDEVWLEKIEQKDRIFRHIDFADFAG